MTLTSIVSKPYGMRDTTLESSKKTQLASPFGGGSRKILTPSKSASAASEKHDCTKVDSTITRLKVVARFVFSYFRFMTAYVWECSVERGGTHYNGARSHCVGACHDAHAALSPNLRNNKLILTIEKIKELGYRSLSKIDQDYFKTQFALTEKDEKKLSETSSCTHHLDRLISRLTPQEFKGSFANTKVGLARNATFRNPTGSNLIDSRIEDRLRAFEDELTEQCRQQLMTPKQAIQMFQKKYQELLKEIEKNLKNDQEHLASLYNSWDQLLKCQANLLKTPNNQEIFKGYLLLIEQYQASYKKRFEKTYGTPRFCKLQEYLDQHQSPFVLKALLSNVKKQGLENGLNFFRANSSHLTTPEDSEASFQQVQEEVVIRNDETRFQLAVVEKPFEELNELLNMEFGQPVSKGVFRSPTKGEMAGILNKSLHPVTPTRSDLNKKRKTTDTASSEEKRAKKSLFSE